MIFSRFLILLGIYSIQSFAQYFIQDRLATVNPAQVTGNLLATIGVALTILVFPAGMLSDRFGRWRRHNRPETGQALMRDHVAQLFRLFLIE